MSYQRVQILLTPEQYRRLKRLAHLQRQSLSSVVRELIQQGLENLPIAGRPREADLSWLEQTHQAVQRMLEARGGEPIAADAVELIRSIREERANELAPRATGH